MPRDAFADFPTTHATFLTRCLDDPSAQARAEVRNHLMTRYRVPLVAYASRSRLANLDEPEELVHGFFAGKVARDDFLDGWRTSGLPLRRWMLNGLLFHARGVMRDLARERARRDAAAHPETRSSDAPDGETAFERAWALALVEAACRAAHASLAADGRAETYALFHRHHFDGVGIAALARESGSTETEVASAIRLAVRRTRAEAESMLRDELGTADPDALVAELERVRELTGWRP